MIDCIQEHKYPFSSWLMSKYESDGQCGVSLPPPPTSILSQDTQTISILLYHKQACTYYNIILTLCFGISIFSSSDVRSFAIVTDLMKP